MLYDIKVAKMMGANVLRKHIKVESDRFYYHAARYGRLTAGVQLLQGILSFAERSFIF